MFSHMFWFQQAALFTVCAPVGNSWQVLAEKLRETNRKGVEVRQYLITTQFINTTCAIKIVR